MYFLKANETGQPEQLQSLALLPSKMHHLKCICLLVLFSLCSADDSLFFFFSSGLRRIYYEQLPHLPANISSSCGETLLKLHRHLNLGDAWANRFVDSSASTPVSVFTGTVTNLGSFDSCINNDKEASQYCLIESVPSSSLPHSPAWIKLKKILPSLSFFNITSGICMPKACDTNEIKNVWSFWLSKYSMKLVNSHKLACSNDNSGEIFSFYAFCALSFVILSQVLIGLKGLLFPSNLAMEKIFSPFVHMKELFNTSDRRATVVDCLKVFMILMGISAHCLLCIEKLVAIALLGELKCVNCNLI